MFGLGVLRRIMILLWVLNRMLIIQRFCNNRGCGQLGAALTLVILPLRH